MHGHDVTKDNYASRTFQHFSSCEMLISPQTECDIIDTSG